MWVKKQTSAQPCQLHHQERTLTPGETDRIRRLMIELLIYNQFIKAIELPTTFFRRHVYHFGRITVQLPDADK